MKVKITGIHWKIFACTGSGGCGLSRCWKYIVAPITSAQAGRCR